MLSGKQKLGLFIAILTLLLVLTVLVGGQPNNVDSFGYGYGTEVLP